MERLLKTKRLLTATSDEFRAALLGFEVPDEDEDDNVNDEHVDAEALPLRRQVLQAASHRGTAFCLRLTAAFRIRKYGTLHRKCGTRLYQGSQVAFIAFAQAENAIAI